MEITIVENNKVRKIEQETLFCITDEKEYSFFPGHMTTILPLINCKIYKSSSRKTILVEDRNGLLMMIDDHIKIILD